MIVAGEMLNISERHEGDSIVVNHEQSVLDAALRGETSVDIVNLSQVEQLEFLRVGYELSTVTKNGVLTTTISWKNAHSIR